jgi:hypothetical protein
VRESEKGVEPGVRPGCVGHDESMRSYHVRLQAKNNENGMLIPLKMTGDRRPKTEKACVPVFGLPSSVYLWNNKQSMNRRYAFS